MPVVLLYGAAAAYLAAVALLYRALLEPAGGRRTGAVLLSVAGLALHALALALNWLAPGPVEPSFVDVLSLCAGVMVALSLASLTLRTPLIDAGLVTLPLAALVVMAQALLPVQGSLLAGHGATTAVHIVSSVMAFCLLALAGVYAGFAALADHFLRHHHLNPLVRALPALEVLETVLFRLVGAGFILLTVALATGLLFVNDLFAQHLVHKTVLSMLAWLLFGLLLWGRWRRGWRGHTAVRLTLAGVVVLVLAYFGSKAVLEVVLHRDWQA